MRLLTTLLAAAIAAAPVHAAGADSDYFFRSKAAPISVEEHYGRPEVAQPAGAAGTIYTGERASISFSVSGGVAPYAWSVSGAPSGLAIDASGTLAGVPVAAGSYDVSVTATDARGTRSDISRRIVVAAPMQANLPASATTQVGKPLSLQLTATGGAGPVTWAVTNLPAWATATAAGLVSGTPSSAGSWQVSATARDAQGRESAVAFALSATAVSEADYVTVGMYGEVMTSKDGTTWTKRASLDTSMGEGVAFGNGLWVAVGEKGLVATSTDGVTWTKRASGVGSYDLNGVVWTGSRFVAVGGNGYVTTSTDGITWNATVVIAGEFTSVAYGNGVIVASMANSTIYRSTNGVSWSQVSGGYGQYISHANGMWFATTYENGTVRRSSNLSSWQVSTVPSVSPYTPSVYSVTYGAGRYVAVGGAGTIATSTDGASWTRVNAGQGSYGVLKVTYGGGRFVAGGESHKIWTSTDGVSFVERSNPGTSWWISGVGASN